MLDSHVLVLNRVFQAIQVTSVRKAFSLFYKGHVRAVLPDYSTYEFENWCDIPVQPQDEVVLTPSMAIRVPRVIALKDFDRLVASRLVPTSLLKTNLEYLPQTQRFLRSEALAHVIHSFGKTETNS